MSIPITPSKQNFPLDSIHFDDINFDNILNQDTAIRRFYPERMDQEPKWIDNLFETETWSSSIDSSSSPCSVSIDEDSSFFESIINISLCGEVEEYSNGEAGSSSEDTTVPPVLVGNPEPDAARTINRGLELVHLLLACAEAVGCRDTALAATMLAQLWPMADANGDSLQRVSFCFATGLKSRLSLLQNVGASGSFCAGSIFEENNPVVTKEEKREAFHHLYQTTPYVAFGFAAANEALCEAAEGRDYLHIVDLGMSHALQWSNLVKTLALRPEGLPRIRITGIASPDSSISDLESNMKISIDEARAIGGHIEFRAVDEPSSPSLLTAEYLDLRQGEALFFNSVMHLHRYVKESRGSLKAVLIAIKKLMPALFTVVEQDASHNGPFFLARFLESLHYYSAVFDSLEASLPRHSLQRMKIERNYFAEEIRNIIACEGGQRVERHERADQWRRQLGRAGFQGVGLESARQARMLVSAYGCNGYTVGSEKGCLLSGWKGRPILWASAWRVNSAPS